MAKRLSFTSNTKTKLCNELDFDFYHFDRLLLWAFYSFFRLLSFANIAAKIFQTFHIKKFLQKNMIFFTLSWDQLSLAASMNLKTDPEEDNGPPKRKLHTHPPLHTPTQKKLDGEKKIVLIFVASRCCNRLRRPALTQNRSF